MKVGYVVQDADIEIQKYQLKKAGCEKLVEVSSIELDKLESSSDIYIWRVDKLASSIEELECSLNQIGELGVNISFVFEGVSSSQEGFSLLPKLAACLASKEV